MLHPTPGNPTRGTNRPEPAWRLSLRAVRVVGSEQAQRYTLQVGAFFRMLVILVGDVAAGGEGIIEHDLVGVHSGHCGARQESDKKGHGEDLTETLPFLDQIPGQRGAYRRPWNDLGEHCKHVLTSRSRVQFVSGANGLDTSSNLELCQHKLTTPMPRNVPNVHRTGGYLLLDNHARVKPTQTRTRNGHAPGQRPHPPYPPVIPEVR